MSIDLFKCRECIHFEEECHMDENGKREYKLHCDMTGKEIPDYDASPKGCMAFRWNVEAWREYAD